MPHFTTLSNEDLLKGIKKNRESIQSARTNLDDLNSGKALATEPTARDQLKESTVKLIEKLQDELRELEKEFQTRS